MIFCLCYFRQSSFEALISNELFFWNQKSCKPYTIVTASFKSSIRKVTTDTILCISDGIGSIGKRSEIGRPVFPHLFRHSVATDMIQRKVPVTVVQKLLGHASVNTTLIYAKMLDTDVKDSHTRTVV